MNDTFNSTDIIDTYFLAITSQGYWGRSSVKECLANGTDPLQTALDNANAIAPSSKVANTIKKGVVIYVDVIVVTEGDRIRQEDVDKDQFNLLPEDAKAGDVLVPYCGGMGGAVYRGTKVSSFKLGGKIEK